jgi:L,D-peptidoglycan transpeptidase YkuD (ErfK/YbiS/YcfS/YnhG family)
MNFETSGRMVAMHAVLAQSPTIRKRWWSQRDSNPCFNSTMTSPFIITSFDDFRQIRNVYD